MGHFKFLVPTVLLFCLPWISCFSDGVNCTEPVTTLEINNCLGLTVEQDQQRLDRYLAKSIERYQDDTATVTALQAAQSAWEKYLKAHCEAVYQQWIDGSIRNQMYLACRSRLIRQRTHELWTEYLTFMDSTPPMLPAP